MAKNKWKRVSSNIVYENPWYKVREDIVINPSGNKSTYSVVEQNESVFTIALSDNDEVHLIELFRYTTGVTSIEVPGGGVFKNEKILQGAKRELEEETGLRAHDWTKIGIIQLENGISDAIGHIFLAKDLYKSNFKESEEEGIENLLVVPIEEAIKMIKDGKITDSISVSALFKATLYLNN